MKKSRLEIKPIRRNLSRVLDSARNGNPESMLKLGKHYSYLKFVDEKYEGDNALLLGVYWLSKAAQNGKWEACYWLGAAIETTRNNNSSSAYLSAYIEREKQENTIWQSVMSELNTEGFYENAVPVYYNDVCKNNVAAIWLWERFHFGYSSGSLESLDCQYYKCAAEHGIIEAKACYGAFSKRAWDTWCYWLQDESPEKALKTLKDEGRSIDSIYYYYETARYWLVEALRDGCDEAISDLSILIATQHMLDKLREPISSK